MDRRKGPPPVSPLHFWLGITLSLVALCGTAIKIGQWTGRVDSSVHQLTDSVSVFQRVAETIVSDHTAMKLQIQHGADVNDAQQRQLDERRGRTTPDFEGLTVK
jgi:hypothetical protein